jgi:hypothetical protein
MMKGMDAEARKRVLEDLITAMEDREAGSKIPGAKPLLQIMISGGDDMGGEGTAEHESGETPEEEIQEDATGMDKSGMPDVAALTEAHGEGEVPNEDPMHEMMESPEMEDQEKQTGREGMPPELEAIIEKRKREQRGY